jgi:hypothetical protein
MRGPDEQQKAKELCCGISDPLRRADLMIDYRILFHFAG